MKRAISVLLLVVLTYNFLGAGFVYNVWFYSIKTDVKQKLKQEFPEEEETLLKLPASWTENPPADFKWHEEHEFRYRGQMYDVIRTERHGDLVWYWVHWDRAETKLLNDLSDYVSGFLQQHPDKQRQHTFLESFLKQIFTVVRVAPVFGLRALAVPAPDLLFSSSSVFHDVDSPPPRTGVNLSFVSR